MSYDEGVVRIGRLSLPSAYPEQITHNNGGTITLSGQIEASSVAEAEVLRDLLIRTPEDQDEVQYCDLEETTGLSGFYRVVDASAQSLQMIHTSFRVPYSVTLEPVVDFQSPAAEVTWTAIRRTNASSIAPANHYLRRAMPDGGWRRVGGGQYVGPQRTTSSGVDQYHCTAARNTTRIEMFNARPGSWYDGITAIEMQVDGAWYPVIGSDIPKYAANSASAVRLTNGLVRVSFNVAGPGQIRHEAWTGTSWQPVDFWIGDSLTYYTAPLLSPTVVHNHRDAVVLRLSGGPTNQYTEGAATITVTLLPGELWAGIQIDPSRAWNANVGHTTNVASTAVTGGLRSTATSPAGTHSVIGTSASFTTNVTAGWVQNTVAGAVTQFCVAQTGAGGRGSAAEIIEDWIGTYVARTRVIPK